MSYVAFLSFLFFPLAMGGCSATSPAKPQAEESKPVKSAVMPVEQVVLPSEPFEPFEPSKPSEEERIIAAVDNKNSIFFQRGVAEIDTTGKKKLLLHAERLKSNLKLHVTLIGSTDDQGSRSLNLAIADKRVNAVYQQLRDFGVARRQLRRVNMGGEKSSKSCRSEACRKLMRRVELRYKH